MSTYININVGNKQLLDQARVQQNASRQAQLEKEANKRLQSEAEINRVNALAAQGKDANGKPLTNTLPEATKPERKLAANRFGEGLLYYFSKPPKYYDDYENPYGLITKGKIQSPYVFSPVSNPFSPFFKYKHADYVASGGPYNQSYINGVLYLGTQEAKFANVAHSNSTPSDMPASFLEPPNFDGYTIEADFRPDEHTDNKVDGVNYPNASFIRIIIVKYKSDAFDDYDRILIELAATSYGGISENLRVVWPSINNTGPFSYVVGPTMPLDLLEWNRIAITVTSLEVNIYINGTFFASVPNDFGLYNPGYAMWPNPPSSYVSAGVIFSVEDTANLGIPNPDLSGVTALSAVRVTPKILYTENYTPTRIT